MGRPGVERPGGSAASRRAASEGRRVHAGCRAHRPDHFPRGSRAVTRTGSRPTGAGSRSSPAVADSSWRTSTDPARQVTPDRLDAQGASWSPDGSKLVFQGRHALGGIGNLFVVDASTGSLRRITDLHPRQSGWWFLWPSFSADGRSVLFHLPRRHWGPTVWDLWSVPGFGGRPVIIRRNAGMGQYSPNGKTVAYLPSLDPRNATGDSLWLMDRTGETRKVVEDRDIWWPRWSPDGMRVAYAAESYEIHVIDVATGRIRTVVDGGVAEWFDDHTLIVGPGGGHS
jgi:Tol biopolymer transport system component